jgi:hypothetical protein
MVCVREVPDSYLGWAPNIWSAVPCDFLKSFQAHAERVRQRNALNILSFEAIAYSVMILTVVRVTVTAV